MKESSLKQLIREVASEIEKNPDYIKGYRLGERDGYLNEPNKDISKLSKLFQLGYKKGQRAGTYKRWSEKVTGGLTKLGQYFGTDTGFHRKF